MNKIQSRIHPVYSQPYRLPLIKSPMSVISSHCSSDGAKILRWVGLARFVLDRSEHLDHAANHFLAEQESLARYSEKIDEAAMALWGRKWQISDYKISAIGSEEFSDAQKQQLRDLSADIHRHSNIARAHAWAGGLREAGTQTMKEAARVAFSGTLIPQVRQTMEMTAARMMLLADMERSGEALNNAEGAIARVRAASADPSLRERISWANTSDFKARVAIAESYIVNGKGSRREFDSCFECWDGDAVAALLLIKAKRHPESRLAENFSKYLTMDTAQNALDAKPVHMEFECWSRKLIAEFESENGAVESDAGHADCSSARQRGG